MLNTLLRTIQRFNLFLPGETPLIAVSGGADSLALLHLLRTLQGRLNISLHAAVFDHKLREESIEDITLVKQLAAEWEIPVTVGSADVHRLASEQGIGIEAAARQARYAFLAQIARQIGAERIVTAHHADDQAETVLMHLLHGTGMQGLQGMAYESSLPGAPDLLLIRPLLDVTHDELLQYCQERGINPRIDATNFDPSFLRNRIRLDILPRLREINPNITQTINRAADITRVDHAFIEQALKPFLQEFVSYGEHHITIDRESFINLHPALQRRCIYVCLNHLQSGASATYEQIVTAVTLAEEGQVGAIAQFPGHLQMRLDYGSLVIEHTENCDSTDENLALLPKGQEFRVNYPGSFSVPGSNWTFEIELGESPHQPAARLTCPAERYIVLRCRRNGDRFQPLGMQGKHQKIKNWMINRKIPRNLRDRVPLVVLDGEIAAVIYGNEWVISERFAIREQTQCVLNLFVNFS